MKEKLVLEKYKKFNECAEKVKENIEVWSIEELKKCKKSFVLVPGIFAEQTNLEKFLATHKEFTFSFEHIMPVNEIKGRIAFEGMVCGRVKILKRKEQISEIQEGEIIVSINTTPVFVPAMEKCSAIVTDEGGLLSHAAIVSRELGKPCIVGTKIATKVFITGELIEVNAEKGIVKKL